ncbi:MAG: Maf family protein [Thermodesulfobacteriota bacterium]
MNTSGAANGSLILASKSPRRKLLLEQAGLNFSVVVSGFKESSLAWSEPVRYTRDLARAKAEEVAGRYPDSWVIGADTIVMADGDLLEKPVSMDDARRMLNRLSGAVHEVYTGFAVIHKAKDHAHVDAVRSEVEFKSLSAAEIEWYIHTDEPYDKAGAYAIQGLGSFLVKSVKGSYTNVVGLPVCEVVDYLLRQEIIRRRAGDL